MSSSITERGPRGGQVRPPPMYQIRSNCVSRYQLGLMAGILHLYKPCGDDSASQSSDTTSHGLWIWRQTFKPHEELEECDRFHQHRQSQQGRRLQTYQKPLHTLLSLPEHETISSFLLPIDEHSCPSNESGPASTTIDPTASGRTDLPQSPVCGLTSSNEPDRSLPAVRLNLGRAGNFTLRAGCVTPGTRCSTHSQTVKPRKFRSQGLILAAGSSKGSAKHRDFWLKPQKSDRRYNLQTLPLSPSSQIDTKSGKITADILVEVFTRGRTTGVVDEVYHRNLTRRGGEEGQGTSASHSYGDGPTESQVRGTVKEEANE